MCVCARVRVWGGAVGGGVLYLADTDVQNDYQRNYWERKEAQDKINENANNLRELSVYETAC